MLKQIFVFLSAAILLSSCGNYKEKNQEVLVAEPPVSSGFSAERLAMADTLINTYMQKGWLPGGVFLVARHGKIAYFKNFGYRSIKHEKKYQKDDIFRIASMTKAITTVAIMQLYEQGKLGIDDPLSNYIPAYKNMGVLDHFNPKDSSFTTIPTQHPITIRNLLTHTSGIAYGDFAQGKLHAIYQKLGLLKVGASQKKWTTEEFVDTLASVPLAFQPGKKFLYGLNMDILGRVIEVVSHEPLNQYFKKHIFDPLGMTDTYFYLPKDKQNRLVPVYSQNENGVTMKEKDSFVETVDFPKWEDRGYYAGGAGLSSTAMDYARFVEMLVENGKYNGNRILGRKTIEMMTSDQLIVQNRNGNGRSQIPGDTFCLGFGLLTKQADGLNSKSPGTYEWGGYFSTKFFIDPKEDLIFVGMTQVLPFRHNEFYDRLTAIIYGAIVDK
ncbi:MAG TPA: serine hydrolase domain-containing protein [Sunxiuqinia sp.]|nr:serine hydrolase domain-containing protein [Sunxiuqinia sp.]